MGQEVNEKRLTDQFISLTKVDAESFHERKMADYLLELYGSLGIDIREDDTAAVTGSDAGNLYGYFPAEKGMAANGSPDDTVLFVGHMDTVAPGNGKKAIWRDDGVITSDGTTVLGADDAAAIAVIIEAIREIKEEELDHRNIELFHPVAEEAYTVGSSAFDFSRFHAKQGYCLDLSCAPGGYSSQEPTLISFKFTIRGKAAHAGFEPENGINSIAAAAAAIARVRQGRPDDHSTLNFGLIRGGTATNAVPGEVTVEGELRSSVHEDALRLYAETAGIFREEAERIGASFMGNKTVRLTAYKVDEDSPALAAYKEALGNIHIEPFAVPTFGGSDNNVLRRNGIDGLCIFNSMHECHTVREWASADELVSLVKIVKFLMTR